MSSWTAASSDCSRPVNNYVHVKTADLYRPNARLTPERQGYQVLTPFGKLGYSLLKTAGARAPAHQARGRGRRTWRPTERTAGARMVPPGEGNEARGDGRRGVGLFHSTAEAGELSPRDPVEGRGHRQVAPLEGKTANTPRLGPVSTSRQRIAELARQAVGMAVAIAWLPGPAGTRRRVAKLSVEEPDAAEPARPDLWGARVSNDPGLPDHVELLRCYYNFIRPHRALRFGRETRTPAMQAGLVSQRLALRDIFTAGGLTRRIFVAVVHVSVTVQPTESDEAELSTRCSPSARRQAA